MTTPKADLVQAAYEHLRREILAGTLSAGSLISEAGLARQLGFSRTPVGEAIRQLARDGLVEQVPRYGTLVRPLERSDLVELFELREALECFAVAQAAERMRPEQLVQGAAFCSRMAAVGHDAAAAGLEELDEPRLAQFLAADLAFHLLLIEAAGNRRIARVVQETETVSRIFRLRRQRHDLRVVETACEFHRRILETLKSKDGAGAAEIMKAHIRASREACVGQFDATQPDARPAPAGDDTARRMAAALAALS